MALEKRIKSALISVFSKEGLAQFVSQLHRQGVKLYSTGGTQDFIEALGLAVTPVEALTNYPSILGGRVKTLHPKVFGGILGRRSNTNDLAQLEQFDIPEIDLVVVDLYPFEETIKAGAGEQEIIEKIDIGGVSLIRAAAKNYADVAVISDIRDYALVESWLVEGNGALDQAQRLLLAGRAFQTIAHYDSLIAAYFAEKSGLALRYGENPHQKGFFEGRLDDCFTQLNGKALSFNNLLDIDAALKLTEGFEQAACAVVKHNNACGFALAQNATEAWEKALEGDPVSVFGGIIAFNKPIDHPTAQLLHKLFFEILLAPDFDSEALTLLKSKSNRIILKTLPIERGIFQVRSVLNGKLWQTDDKHRDQASEFRVVTEAQPAPGTLRDLELALHLVKHTRSNAISLVKQGQLIGNGVGQTSRIDAMKQAIAKAQERGFDTQGAVLASDAFFPFPDTVALAAEAGISAIAQPGGSIKDAEVIAEANRRKLAMIFTGIRHFKH